MHNTKPRFLNHTARLHVVALLAAFATFTLAISAAYAGQYVLEKGKGVEVCEAYLKNLNSFDRVVPLACEREIHPSAKDFKKPAWKKLDAWENRELVTQTDKFLHGPYGYSQTNPQSWEEYVKGAIERHHLEIDIAKIDIDNDGKPENVIKYYSGSCETTGTYSTPILVVNPDLRTLDVEKTMRLMQNPTARMKNPNPEYGDIVIPPERAGDKVMYDVFSYKTRTYFDRGVTLRQRSGIVLKVYKTEDRKTNEICTYRFIRTDLD